MAHADYKVFIDWDQDGGLALSNFEGSPDGWYAFGTTPPDLYNKPVYSPNPRAAHQLTDSFPGTFLDPVKWVQPDTGTAVASNQLTLTSSDTMVIVTSRTVSFDRSYIQAKVAPPAFDPSNSTQFLLNVEIGNDLNNWAGFYWSAASTDVTASCVINGVTDVFTTTYDPVEMAYVRVEEDGGKLYYKTSPNGIIWNNLWTTTHTLNFLQSNIVMRTDHSGTGPVNTIVSEFNTIQWPIYTGSDSLLVDWYAYNPFRFDVAGAGFSQGRFGANIFSNPTDVFMFDTASHGFDDGRFAYLEAYDPQPMSPGIRYDLKNLTIGQTYTASIQVWVPTTNSSGVTLSVAELSVLSSSTLTGQWQEVALEFTATATTHTLELAPTADPAEADHVWVDQARILSAGEDVTVRTFNRTEPAFERGRDSARTLDANSPSSMNLELDNSSRDYSPANDSSPIYGKVQPGKEVLFTAKFKGIEYPLYRGYIDDLTLHPYMTTKSLELETVDLWSYLAETHVSSELYKGIRTGTAIHRLLDLVNWPKDRRKIDAGATIIPWWWVDDESITEAFEALQKSEGPPSICYVDGFGNFVFKDRHHRLLDTNSRTSQVNFVMDDVTEEDGLGVAYSEEFTYNLGWKDLYNEVVFDVEVRKPSVTPVEIYTSEETISVAPGETREIAVVASDPFYDAITPTPYSLGTVMSEDTTEDTPQEADVFSADYYVDGNVTVSITKRSGLSTTIRLVGGVGGGSVTGLRLRATTLESQTTVRITASDPGSIDVHKKKTYSDSPGWLNIHDALAIANGILGLRSERLPVITFVIKPGTDARLEQILQRGISDRVHIYETETFTDFDHFVEKIEHTVTDGGLFHTCILSFEQARDQPDNVFTFDDPLRGFDDGFFGYTGIDNADRVFVLNQSNLNEGLLGT